MIDVDSVVDVVGDDSVITSFFPALEEEAVFMDLDALPTEDPYTYQVEVEPDLEEGNFDYECMVSDEAMYYEECQLLPDITRHQGVTGRKPRTMRTKKNRLLTSVTVNKLKELVAIDQKGGNGDIPKAPFKRVLRPARDRKQYKHGTEHGNCKNSRPPTQKPPIPTTTHIDAKTPLDESMCYVNSGRDPPYRQNRYEIALFVTRTLKITPLFLMARCVDCHVDTHLDQRYFNFVLPYNPFEVLRNRPYEKDAKRGEKDDSVGPSSSTNCIFQIQIQIPFEHIHLIDPHPKHVLMKLKTRINPAWVDIRNNSTGLWTGKLGERLEMARVTSAECLHAHLQQLKDRMAEEDTLEFTFIKKNMVWLNHLIKADFGFFGSVIDDSTKDKASIRKILKQKMEGSSTTRRVKKISTRQMQSFRHLPELMTHPYDNNYAFEISDPEMLKHLVMTFKVTVLHPPVDGKHYVLTGIETGYQICVAFPVLMSFIETKQYDGIKCRFVLDQSLIIESEEEVDVEGGEDEECVSVDEEELSIKEDCQMMDPQLQGHQIEGAQLQNDQMLGNIRPSFQIQEPYQLHQPQEMQLCEDNQHGLNPFSQHIKTGQLQYQQNDTTPEEKTILLI
uniref:SWIM-type domain-containing protein n=1 Tax=Rhabditophanes sp. KR3021 TaxID=114890 RepID=A0AC35TZS3_9BILA